MLAFTTILVGGAADSSARYLREDLGWQCPILVSADSSSRAHNQEALRAQTPWLLFLDAAVRPGAELLPMASEFLAQNPWVDALTVAPPPEAAPSRTVIQWFLQPPHREYPALTVGVDGRALFISHSAFSGAGGFDERMNGLAAGLDLGFRLWWYGYRACSLPLPAAIETADVVPNSDWVYLHLKWFPGHSVHMLWLAEILHRPWAAFHLSRSFRHARALFRRGPIYPANPQARQRPPASEQTSSSDPVFTVIIPTRNRASLAGDLLRYLRQDLAWTCPIVVVDQSDDGGAALAALLQEQPSLAIQHIPHHQRNSGAARNEGARRAATPWLLFLDDDVRPVAQFWDELRCFLCLHPWADAAFGRLFYGEEWRSYRQNPASWWEETGQAGDSRMPPQPHWSSSLWFLIAPRANYPALTIGLGAGNFAISRRCFFAAGGFDEQVDAVGVDREMGIRLWWYGYRVCFAPTMVAFHLKHPTGGRRFDTGGHARLSDLPPAWIYTHLKWFSPHSWRTLVANDLLPLVFPRPWRAIRRAFQIRRSWRVAEQRLRQGPLYASPPLPRPQP